MFFFFVFIFSRWSKLVDEKNVYFVYNSLNQDDVSLVYVITFTTLSIFSLLNETIWFLFLSQKLLIHFFSHSTVLVRPISFESFCAAPMHLHLYIKNSIVIQLVLVINSDNFLWLCTYMHVNEFNQIEKVDSYYYENDPPSWIYMETLREKKKWSIRLNMLWF